jgi:hypothetical protein
VAWTLPLRHPLDGADRKLPCLDGLGERHAQNDVHELHRAGPERLAARAVAAGALRAVWLVVEPPGPVAAAAPLPDAAQHGAYRSAR